MVPSLHKETACFFIHSIYLFTFHRNLKFCVTNRNAIMQRKIIFIFLYKRTSLIIKHCLSRNGFNRPAFFNINAGVILKRHRITSYISLKKSKKSFNDNLMSPLDGLNRIDHGFLDKYPRLRLGYLSRNHGLSYIQQQYYQYLQ